MFQSQARPPLPCHRRNCRRRQKSEQVSISGETTAPLPHTLYQENRPGIVVSISGETTAPLPPPHLPGACRAACTFQSQARPPLPCHRSWRRERIADTVFQSQARPPLPCHCSCSSSTSTSKEFQSQARPPLPCHPPLTEIGLPF